MSANDPLKFLKAQAQLENRRCWVEDSATGRIHFTRTGLAKYGPVFAKAGITIQTIRTFDQLKDAWARSQWVEIDELRKMVAGHPELEQALAPIFT